MYILHYINGHVVWQIYSFLSKKLNEIDKQGYCQIGVEVSEYLVITRIIR